MAGGYFPDPFFPQGFLPEGFFGPEEQAEEESYVETPSVYVGGGGTSGYGYGHGLTHYRRGPRPVDIELPVEIETREVSGKVFIPALQIAGAITLGATISGVVFLPTMGITGEAWQTMPPARPGVDLGAILSAIAASDVADDADLIEIADLIEDLDEVL